MIAIHNSKAGFHPRWAEYCQKNSIPYKIVDCYANDLIEQLEGCDGLMWHYSQGKSEDILIAKEILFALEHTGFKVFPDFKTAWHFDDKVAQKYLLERIDAPMIPSFVFFEKRKALQWIDQTTFPKVFKLRGGAGSANVKLVRDKVAAKKLVGQAFGRGFKQYDSLYNLKDRLYKFRQGKTDFFDLLKGIVRIGMEPEFSKTKGWERGYIYFQDFMPNNDCDIRIIIVDNKAFALKRMVRKGDFRASGSGEFYFDKELFDERCIKIAFKMNKKIQSQSLVLDFIFDEKNQPLLVELSYGFTKEPYYECPGYWDSKLVWHEGKFNSQAWMVDALIKEINS